MKHPKIKYYEALGFAAERAEDNYEKHKAWQYAEFLKRDPQEAKGRRYAQEEHEMDGDGGRSFAYAPKEKPSLRGNRRTHGKK